MEENENIDSVQTEEQPDEEKWVDVTELFEGEAEPPTKEQILKGARQENEKGDEREQQDLVKANSLAMSVGFFIAGIIIIVSSLVKDYLPFEVILITCSMQATQAIFVAMHNRRLKKLYLTIGIIEVICSVILLVTWILQLCGVM